MFGQIERYCQPQKYFLEHFHVRLMYYFKKFVIQLECAIKYY